MKKNFFVFFKGRNVSMQQIQRSVKSMEDHFQVAIQTQYRRKQNLQTA